LQRRGSADGSSLGTTPFGATAGLDDPNFRYDYYIEQMLAIIGNNWIRPSVGEAQMTVHFRIARDGSLSEVEVVERSGSSSFDLAGERAVRLSSPLPPLPSSYRHPSLGVNLIIR
jgi:TonB family protein